jgi:hypothetical protein
VKSVQGLEKATPEYVDVWYARQVARLEIAAGRDAETIRKHMKK